MIDLEKEFRTLRLLASALLIIGVGLMLGGFGIALLVHDATPQPKHRPGYVVRPEAELKPAEKDPNKILTSYSGQLGVPTGMLGILFLGLGWTLRWIIRNNVDDGDGPIENHELFKAYAQQLVVAEKQKAKNRKRLQ